MVVLAGAETFRADGGADAVLLCHGFTGSPQGLRPWAEDLAAAGLTVRLPRLPGHGTSWQQMARTTWADWVERLSTELSDLRASGHRVVVGGLSMGGALALRLAADEPAEVAGLVLVNPAVTLSDRRVGFVPVVSAADSAVRRLLPGSSRWSRREPLSYPGIAGDVAAPGVTETGYDRVPLAALASMVGGFAGVRRDLRLVRAPLVVLRSAVDHVVPAASSAVVAAGVTSPDVRVEVLPRSWHVATLDFDAPRITEVTLDLVARVGAGVPAVSERSERTMGCRA